MSGSTNEGAQGSAGSASSSAGSSADDVRHAFAGLSLEDKILTLINVELDMLGDAVDTVVSAVSGAVDDIARACERSDQSAQSPPGAGGQTATN